MLATAAPLVSENALVGGVGECECKWDVLDSSVPLPAVAVVRSR